MKDNNKSILLTIIIPVYKVEQYIERCVRSVMQQAMDDELIECIFVDDCSPDNSVSLIECLLADWQGNISFVILHHEHNRGLSAAHPSSAIIFSRCSSVSATIAEMLML